MRAVSATLLLVVLITTVGCSTIQQAMQPRVSYPGAFEKKDCASGDWTTVNGALGCATVARRDLESRAGGQAMIPRVIGAVLIPLGAAIAGLAMTGTTGAPITALTLGGVAAMGEGLWLSSPQRRQAYSIGASAVQCVITNTRPLAFRDDETKLDAFQARVLQLPEVILGVNFKIDALREVLAKLATPPDATTLRVIQEEITEAQTAVSTAKKLVTKAEDVIRQMNGAAEDIHASVDRVISLVNEEIDKLEPTMEDVRKAIADQIQLRTSAFTGLDALVKDSEAKSKARETAKKTAALRSPLEQARIDLSEAVTELTTAMAAISKDVDRLGQAQPPQGCLTTAQGALGAGVLVVTMSSDEPVAPGQTVVFLVSGGVGDVQIKTDTESQATLDVKYDTVGGVKQVVVKVKSEAKPGTYLIDVVDKVANKIVKIVVKAPPPPPLKITGADADKVKKPAAGIAPQALSYTVTGGSGTTCKATLDPKEGFADPQTFPTGDKCVIILSWAPTPKTGPYTLTVTFGEASPVVRKFTVE